MIIADFDLNGKRQIVNLNPICIMGEPQWYHLYINDYFITSISPWDNGWRVHFNNNSWLTMDEANIIIDLIESGVFNV